MEQINFLILLIAVPLIMIAVLGLLITDIISTLKDDDGN
tara:strand:- start:118 stop:234 length:117 start_codon:yes stop_codon:yes gene_type:complete